MDIQPMRWFKEPLSEGPLKGYALDLSKYDDMLKTYYRNRGWDNRGIPRKSALKKLGLPDVATKLEKCVKLSD
jgi:aldehyde:ferredoxin oxidoreductase